MRILKISIDGLPNFKNNLTIDFMAQQRVDDNDKEQLIHVFSNIYTNPIFSFIGINASGKTTILKAITFTIGLLNNEAINNISSKEVLDELQMNKNAVFTSYFYHNDTIYKIKTVIEKKVNSIDGSAKLVIKDEKLWSKTAHKVKTKKDIYNFNDTKVITVRNKDEQYLMEDVSIMIAINKKQDTNFNLYDMSALTDYNMLNVLGKFPKEILTFLDPSIEELSCKSNEKKVEIRLKFYGKDVVSLNRLIDLNRYLSSGTIKGLCSFVGAIFSFVDGGYLIIDELENHFNKEIALTLMRFFMDKRVNKTGATLIFSTHYSELLDEFDRNDSIYIVKNNGGITADLLSHILKRNDIKKSEIYDSDFLEGTVPVYESYIALKKALISM